MKLLNEQEIDLKITNIDKPRQKTIKEIYDFLSKNSIIKEQVMRIFNIKSKYDEQKIFFNFSSDIWMFINDKKYCLNCPGFEKCCKRGIFFPHYKIDLVYDGVFVFQKLLPCDLKIEYIKKNSSYIFKDFIYLGPFRDYPYSLISLKISNLDVTRNRLALFEKCSEIMANAKKTKWIFIFGSFLSGKTYVSVAILNDLLAVLRKNSKEESAVFLNFPKRISELQNVFFSDQKEFKKLISLYYSVPFLVIDNFGDEFKSEFIRDKIIWPILLARAENNLVTIFNSRFDYDNIFKMYSMNYKDGAIGKQIVELLKKMCGKPFDISTKIYI